MIQEKSACCVMHWTLSQFAIVFSVAVRSIRLCLSSQKSLLNCFLSIVAGWRSDGFLWGPGPATEMSEQVMQGLKVKRFKTKDLVVKKFKKWWDCNFRKNMLLWSPAALSWWLEWGGGRWLRRSRKCQRGKLFAREEGKSWGRPLSGHRWAIVLLPRL